jgi:hypothetical protein
VKLRIDNYFAWKKGQNKQLQLERRTLLGAEAYQHYLLVATESLSPLERRMVGDSGDFDRRGGDFS